MSSEIPDVIGQKLVDFTRIYHERLEAELTAKGRDRFPHHGTPTELISVFKASDGWATFYLPLPKDEEVKPGLYFFDLSDHDLNAVCQSLSVNRLKVADAAIGRRVGEQQKIPPDALPTPVVAPWINNALRQAAVTKQIDVLPGLTISPVVHFEAGIRQKVVPGRVKIWSPVFDFETVGVQRLYLWTHADFWWEAETLDLSPETAIKTASEDLVALDTVFGEHPFYDTTLAGHDTDEQAASILETYCEEFVRLLDEHADSEETIHQWLADPRHKLFIDLENVEIRSKVPFGAHTSDFVVRRADGTYVLIEIERPGAPLFRADGEMTAPFHHACEQVYDWQRYVRDNVHTVRNELHLPGIDNPLGRVVMGRSSQFQAHQDAETRWKSAKARREPEVFTYDEIVQGVRNLAAQIRALGKA